ncbi:MAG: heparinase II/III family protein [Candidatus Cloacimonadia bacterium]
MSFTGLKKTLINDSNLNIFKTNLRSRYLWSWEERGHYIDLFRKTFNRDIYNKIILDADLICDHVFNFLGSGEVSLGREIEWKCDLKTRVKWPSYKSHLVPVLFQRGSDIIRVWELSRFQWGPALGKAYWFTSDEKYVKEFIDQFSHWSRENPIGFGPNWVSAQEAALRVINWILTLNFIGDSRSISVIKTGGICF